MRDLQYAFEDYIAEVKQEDNLQIILNSGNMEYLWKLTEFVSEPIKHTTKPSINDYAKVDWELLDIIQTKMIEALQKNLNDAKLTEENINYFCYFINNIPGANKDKYHYFSDIFVSKLPLWIKRNLVPLNK